MIMMKEAYFKAIPDFSFKDTKVNFLTTKQKKNLEKQIKKIRS